MADVVVNNSGKLSHSPESFGVCEHCGILISVQAWLIAIFKKHEWPSCLNPECKKQLSNKSFGYEKIDGEWRKIKWVGPGKLWQDKRPTEDFEIEGWYVKIHP
ncbi:MAG: hypothetical protein HY773_02875 [Candidatus Terrybacteria bacterium]|nr:hypothetical protein [Candidatus Terrybacteria bacterium]